MCTTNMPRYEANEKAAFDWAATVDVNSITRDHILKAYRLNLKSCSVKPNPCKRNCNNNPKCISGLGESRLFSNKEGSSINLEDEERREPGSFAGLKNLGATCYVNSLLQVWYHNPFLREAIYKWKPEDDEKEISAQLNRAVSLTDLASGVQFSPVSPVGQLQLIFARLQFSTRRYVDPTQFVNSLQLDVSQQQDAQEFSKLFLTLLEDDLSTQKDFKVKNIVQTQYCGEYEYVTRCSNCGTESTSPSKFYELSLNIRGHKDIHQCLDEFFSPEILEGSNQYYCNTCESKQNVIRTIRLRKCPPYLNLQLLRFIYDRQKNCRRKLNSSINFPLTLDMRKYFQETVTGCTEYHLCAVLVHRGQSAHSGHYIAHIKDRETGDWYKFNDEFVEKTEGNVIKLCADGSSPPKETSSPPPPPFLSSSGSPLSSTSTSAAFSTGTSSLPLSEIKSIPLSCSASSSFSYSSSSSPLPSPSSSSPSAATAAAAAAASTTTGVTVNPTSKSTEKESTKFSKGSSDPYMLVYKSAVLDDKKLPSDSSVQWDIPEYLQTIVVEENSIFEDHLEIKRKERDQRLAMNREKQEEMLSIYKKLIIKDNEPFEWINKNWLKDWLHSDFKGPVPPLDNSPALCPHNKLALKAVHAMKCVNSEGASILFNLYSGQPRLIDALCRRCVEFKVNSIQIRYKLTEDSKQISSILKFSLPLNEQAFWVGKESLRCWKQFALHKSENTEESETGDSDSENQPPTQNECSFQSNCNVDKLDFNFNEEIICEHGKLTCDESVRRLVPLAVWNILKCHFPLSPEFDRSTAPCEDCLSNSLSAETLKNQCRKIANEQKQQLTDLYSTKYHIGLNDMIPGTNYYLLNYQFYLEWKNFIRDPVNNDCPSVIDNSPLKCIHQRLLYPPSMNEQNNLSESKFLILKENEWTKLSELYNYESAITVRVQVNEMSEEKVIITDPAHCKPCYDQLVEMEMEKLLNYKDAKIYVRKIQNKPDDQQDPEAEDDSYDSSFAGANRKRMKGQQGCDSSQAIQSVPSPSGNKAPRRSSRRRKYRDEREFTVSSLQTLLSLKIEIMHDFKVAPYDQDLFLNEVPLQGNDRTLAELKVVPNSLIYLKVDEPNCSGSSILEEDYIKDHAPETGFKGTQLQKC